MLDPNDPIDLAAIMEVEAIAPALPPILPTRDFDADFARLEEAERLRQRERAMVEEKQRRRRHDEHEVRLRALGEDYVTDPAADQWHSRDRKITLTRAQLDSYMRRWQ
jgi:hypothetical protein